jgi:uroporphyrinogen decarboxylase
MRIPLSLSVYEHAAAVIGRTPWEVSRDKELLWQAHSAAYEIYNHFPVIVGTDIYNIEAEAYGCVVAEPAPPGIPAIIDHPCASLDDALKLDGSDLAERGRVGMLLEVGCRLKDAYPDADVRIPLSGPFSIAQNLVGLTPLIMAVALETDGVKALLNHLIPGQLTIARAVKDAGLDVAFFESAAAPPLLSPAMFRDIELDPLKTIIKGVADIVEHPVPCIIGGDTVHIIPEILETGTDFVICPSETDRDRFVAVMDAHPEVLTRVNIDPGLYATGTKDQIRAEIDAVVELAAGRENILLGTGAIPYETPTENLLFMKEYCAEELE